MINYEELKSNGIKRNLPVLYTLPKWKLVRGSGRNGKYYYLPYFNKWIGNHKLRKELSILNLSIQDYYDRWFLNITTKSQRPKCPICGKENLFKGIGNEYTTACSMKCGSKYSWAIGNKDYEGAHEDRSNRAKEIFSRPEVRQKISESVKRSWSDPNSIRNTDEYKNKLSNGLKRFYSDPDNETRIKEIRYKTSKSISKLYKDPNSTFNSKEYRDKLSKCHIKTWSDKYFKEKQLSTNKFFTSGPSTSSKMSRDFFSRLELELRKSGHIFDCRYEGVNKKEHYIGTGPIVGDHKRSRRLDFYIPDLNKWIEFNGDYWHRNPLRYGDDEDSIRIREKDAHKLNCIHSRINTYPLIIWEYDYVRNSNKCIYEALNFILEAL